MNNPPEQAQNLTFSFYTSNGAPVQLHEIDGAEQLVAESLEWLAYVEAEIQVNKLPKPDWFVAQEKLARKFMASIGFTNLAEIVLLPESDNEEDDIGIDPTLIACVTPIPSMVKVNNDRVMEMYEEDRPDLIGATLVHELGHATAPAVDTIHVTLKDDDFIMYTREGFITLDRHGVCRGTFLEEGFAHFLSGWFRRVQQARWQSVIGLTEPTNVVPDYLDLGDNATMAGRDGLALELLVWTADKKGIISSNDFVATLLESRRLETRTAALCTTARVIQALRPGLYTDIMQLQYTKDDWDKGLLMAHDVATQISV